MGGCEMNWAEMSPSQKERGESGLCFTLGAREAQLCMCMCVGRVDMQGSERGDKK